MHGLRTTGEFKLLNTNGKSTNGTFVNGERIGKGNKKLLEPKTAFDLLWKGKGDGTITSGKTFLPRADNNISFIFIDLLKSDDADQDGPKKFYYISKVLGTCVSHQY